MYPNLTHAKGPTVMTSATNTDEAAAVAAMFKAQTDVWEETQEKMSFVTQVERESNSCRGNPEVSSDTTVAVLASNQEGTMRTRALVYPLHPSMK